MHLLDLHEKVECLNLAKRKLTAKIECDITSFSHLKITVQTAVNGERLKTCVLDPSRQAVFTQLTSS